MKFSKKALAAGVCVALSAAMVFAGGSSEAAASKDGKVTLKVLNYLDMTSANSADEITVLWEGFEKANPDIVLEREDLFNEPFHQKVEAYAAAGQLPDVIYAWPSGRSTTLHTKKLLKDLRPLLEKDGLVAKYNPLSLVPQGGGYLGELPNGLTQTHVL
ncbi:MAG TPA: carbohydrate ABC transporter substrate-binding protein, partial [Treponemataceae bacterium]|nr:carbohydrate ABC transporter substrate-binding protein [Treponemataceae bacterium]